VLNLQSNFPEKLQNGKTFSLLKLFPLFSPTSPKTLVSNPFILTTVLLEQHLPPSQQRQQPRHHQFRLLHQRPLHPE
jgi:hypothetical protein